MLLIESSLRPRKHIHTSGLYSRAISRYEGTTLTASRKREFVFTTHLDDVSLPLLRTALQGAMSAYGIDEDKAAEAAGLVAEHLSAVPQLMGSKQLQMAFRYDGKGGSFTIHADRDLDLSGLCDVISRSRAWSAHACNCENSADATVIVVELKKE